jgi:hypothetical protein
MNVNLSSSWQGLKERVNCGCTFIQEGAQIVGESVSYLALQTLDMISPSIAPKFALLYERVCNIWQRIKSHFEKKKLKEEIQTLKTRVAFLAEANQILTSNLGSANQQNDLLLRQMRSLRSSYALVQKQRDLFQRLAAQPKAGHPWPVEGAPCELDPKLEKQVQQFLNQNPLLHLDKV